MIVTLTANPAIDRLVTLREPLVRGGVMRSDVARDQPGGKGINVARVLHAAAVPTLAVLPAAPGEPLLKALSAVGLPYEPVAIEQPIRVNLTLAEDDGTTTKVNSPGPELTADDLDRLAAVVQSRADEAGWVVISGSIPPGVAANWYGLLTAHLRSAGVRVALDTSGDPLISSLASPQTAPSLMKPNGAELAELVGGDGDAIEADPALAARHAQQLRDERGVDTVLLTLGGTGAVLASPEGSWFCAAPKIRARSTVGAGDSSLAGYLIAEAAGLRAPECLATAVAHGSAAASLPGSTLPTPADLGPLPQATAV